MRTRSLTRKFCTFVISLLVVAGVAGVSPAVYASCAGMAQAPGPHSYFMRAAAQDAIRAVPPNNLRITFIGHSTFEIESPEGARVQTDFNDYVQGPRLPHIVTMNNTHDSHFSFAPPKGIEHALRGWDPKGGVAKHNLKFRDIRVRNVPTNLAERGDGGLANGNSMFVIEGVGLCVVHISHLHHYLSKDQLRSLGAIDVAFAPIDGMWTMSHDELFRVLGDIKARMIIPMHYGSMGGVEAFVARAKEKWPVRRHDSNTMLVNLRNMPRTPEVVFLQGF
jgi:L-ascorbate metabolism protein UlaG (beta-lactamase superfamily)